MPLDFFLESSWKSFLFLSTYISLSFPICPLSLATYMKVLVMDCVLTLAMGSDQCVSQPG